MSEAHQIVFIIDDDVDIRTSLSRALIKRGFQVQTYESAQAFLDNSNPDQLGCIILDYGMPDMNGLELQEKLIADGHAMPIIFITGHGGVPESVAAIKGGAIDFLEKPFRTDVLVERIRFAIETSREMEIVGMIVSNPSNSTSKEIARALDISPRTIDHHRARILEKMQIKSMVELIDLAIASQVFERRQ